GERLAFEIENAADGEWEIPGERIDAAKIPALRIAAGGVDGEEQLSVRNPPLNEVESLARAAVLHVADLPAEADGRGGKPRSPAQRLEHILHTGVGEDDVHFG